ncbi:hypothetical protein ACFL4T_01590 [candidate division KSB1 bacterium]
MKTKILSKILVFSVLIFTFFCSSGKRKTYVVVSFDVEDYTTPESEGIDDIPKWLAEIMTEEEATGTFFVIGEKARSLEKRERFDVISAMAKHDIGSHINYGSIHPSVTEQLEKAGWDEGVAEMFEQESEGFRDLERIFGVPVTALAKHGGSYGPQLVSATGKLNAGFVYSPLNLPGKNEVWFCNTLNFYGEYGGFDNTYFKDELFEPIFDTLKVRFPKPVQESEVITFFVCHPCKVRTKQFWDFNFYYGANPDSGEWKTPEMRSLESMETVKKNFRRLMKYLRSRDDIELTTFLKVVEIYSKQKEYVTSKELNKIALKVLKDKAVIVDDHFSPAEVFAGLIKSINKYKSDKKLPDRLKRISPLGPKEIPPVKPEVEKIGIEQVFRLAQKAKDYIEQHGTLPSFLELDNSRIGTGSLLALFSKIYLDLNSGKPADEYSIPAFDAYPKINEKIISRRVEGMKSWPVHRRDLDMSRIVEMTLCQLWTLKPAWADLFE